MKIDKIESPSNQLQNFNKDLRVSSLNLVGNSKGSANAFSPVVFYKSKQQQGE